MPLAEAMAASVSADVSSEFAIRHAREATSSSFCDADSSVRLVMLMLGDLQGHFLFFDVAGLVSGSAAAVINGNKAELVVIVNLLALFVRGMMNSALICHIEWQAYYSKS